MNSHRWNVRILNLFNHSKASDYPTGLLSFVRVERMRPVTISKHKIETGLCNQASMPFPSLVGRTSTFSITQGREEHIKVRESLREGLESCFDVICVDVAVPLESSLCDLKQ